jgi:chromosome segregation ATPase
MLFGKAETELEQRSPSMALQLGALREALLEAGATAEKADRASEEAAGYENRLSGIERAMTALEARIDARMTALEAKIDARMTALEARITALEARMTSIEARMTMLMSVVGLNVALTAGVLWRLLSH